VHYVYILKSLKDNKLYIGKTDDLQKRFEAHNNGHVRATKSRKPFKMIFYEGFSNKADAGRDELFYKTGYGREVLKDKLKNSLEDEFSLSGGEVA